MDTTAAELVASEPSLLVKVEATKEADVGELPAVVCEVTDCPPVVWEAEVSD